MVGKIRKQLLCFLFVLDQLQLARTAAGAEHEHDQEPKFTTEFPLNLDFSNSIGGKLSCNARDLSQPNITWLLVDGSPVTYIPKLRQPMPDGTLIFPPFTAEDYRQDIHGVSYKCAATNSLGTLVSHEIKVRGVVYQPFDVNVYDVYAIRGNTAVMRCHIPKFLLRYVNVTAWIKDSVASITASNAQSNSKYVVLPTGELLIKEVDTSDGHTTYRCQVTHRLSNEVKISSNPGRLIVTDSQFKVPPKIIYTQTEVNVLLGEKIVLACIASGNPAPKYIWSKQTSFGSLDPIQINGRVKLTSDSLVIEKAQITDRGTYICTADNEVNSDKVSIQVTVTEPLKVIANPGFATVDANQAKSISCKISGSPIHSIYWLKDGKPIPKNEIIQTNNETIYIPNMSSQLVGIYQCFAENELYSSYAVSVIKLGDTIPKIVRGFAEQTLKPGQNLMLQCSAKGNPTPQFVWKIDSFEFPLNGRGQINMKSEANNEVTSILRISNVEVKDGGVYTCIAKTKKGEDFYLSRINVKGSLGVRSNVKYEVNEGNIKQLDCPIYGYPIKSIEWERKGKTLPLHVRHVIPENGSLIINNVQSNSDNGKYSCSAIGNDGKIVKAAVELFVMVPPKVSPFSFQDELIREGARARIQCVVREGQSPIKIIWLKNKQPIDSDQGILIREIDEFSSILMISSISPRHNGNYTCKATNAAGTAQHTATLFVNVAPKITPFSFPKNVYEGQNVVRISCVVYQGDLPLNFKWLKNGLPLVPNEKISTTKVDEYSNILKVEKLQTHDAGNYTCVASNSAATVSYTAQLIVYVPPKVVPFTFQDDFLSEGMLVRVSCVVSRGDLPLSISWLKDDKIIAKELAISVRAFDEYSSVLSIDPVRREHAGNYTCNANNHAGVSTHTAKLTVRVPPRWTVEPKDETARTGSYLLLHCQADGFPKPIITWEKAKGKRNIGVDKEIIENTENIEIYSNGTLSFKSIQQSDEGFYICVANNGIQEPLTYVASIKVQAAPEFARKYVELKAKKGDEIEIACEANGNWPINYKWSANKHAIDSVNTRYKIIDVQDEANLKSISKLQVPWVDRKDSTTFSCTAKNDIGESVMNINLIVQEEPEAPVISTPIRVVNQRIELAWTLTNDGNNPVKRYIVQYKKDVDRWEDKMKNVIVPSSSTNVNLTHLKPATLYNFRVMAENEIGNGTFSNTVTAKTEENAPEGPPENVDVESIDANTLRITWNPPKKHLWNGAIQGYNIGYKIHGSTESYTFVSLEVPEDYTEELIYQLTELQMYTQYDIIVQAHNAKGLGPESEIVLAMTSEDVPSSPPAEVRCSSLSSKSIYVLWESPAPETINGILRGYKILYKPVDEWYDALLQSKILETSKVTITDLNVNTNYSIQVLAFTKMGDGIKSSPIYCRTHEDVPEPPASIKVLPSSSDSVMVAWKPPHRSNGALTKYNIYYKPIENADQVNVETQRTEELQRDASVHQSNANSQFVELKGLKKNKKYAFWITATSAIGESTGSSVVAQTVADSIVAAKTASFDDIIKTPWQEDVVLPCTAVGIPIPNRKWTVGDFPVRESSRLKVQSDGSLIINKVSSEDSGNYTCAVYNEHGRDKVNYLVAVQVPPSAPIMDIVSKSRTSIKIQWKPGVSGAQSIRGYLLHYKRDNDIWNTVEIRADQALHTLNDLVCGSTYHLYMEAFNNIGTGLPCDTITITTDGADVASPSKEQIIREGSTFITVYLEAWPSTGCPVKSFFAEYKPIRGGDWTTAGSNIKPTQKKLVISGLNPATWYILRLKVESSNKQTVTDYRFATYTPSGGTLAPDTVEESLAPVYIFYLDPLIFIPAIALLIVVIIASVVVCFYFKRRNGSVGTPSDTTDADLNTWIHHSQNFHTIPRGQFAHFDRHTTLPRKSSEPSPYATSHLTDCNHPEFGKNFRPGSGAAFYPIGNEAFQKQAMFVPSRNTMSETEFVFPTPPNFQDANRVDDDYDPPPQTHMIRNLLAETERRDESTA